MAIKRFNLNPYLEIVDQKSTNALKFVSLFLMSQIGVKGEMGFFGKSAEITRSQTHDPSWTKFEIGRVRHYEDF